MSALPHDDSSDTGGHAAWQRVSKRTPCRICEGPKGCLVAPNGDVACLRRQSDEQVRYGGPTAWWHRTDAPIPVNLRHTPAPATPKPHTASIEARDRVNRRVLDLCQLSPGHHAYVAALHQRADLATLYGSLPARDDQRAIIDTLIREFGFDLLCTVPGFIIKDGRLRLNGAGLLVAIYDVEGRLVAFQVRYGPGDYRWLSTSNGPSTGAPYHIARPLARRDHRIYLVESPKTANILADRLGAVAIATAGHGNWTVARAALEHLIAHEGAEVAVVALDADDPVAKATTVAQVEHSRQQLVALAHRLGLHAKVARWAHADGKGPDDLLLAGHTWDLTVHRPAAEASTTPLIDPHGPAGDRSMVSVEPHFLAWLIRQTAATAELRVRYNYVLAVMRDPAMNDGQKLTEIALFSHLPVGPSATPPEPVTVAAATIARELGSKVTKQKDGSLRPTKLTTVTKNLGDLINLGVRTRDEVVTEKVIRVPNKRDKDAPPIEKTITVTSYAYHGSGSLPGQRMDREEAREAATGAKLDRERPRCSRCYGARLKPRSYVCEDCGHESSSADAARAGREIVDDGHGRFIHRITGEFIEPGIRAEGAGRSPACHDRNPVMGKAGGRGTRTAVTGDRIPVTKKPSREGDRIPVMAPMLSMFEPPGVGSDGPGVSTSPAVPSPAAECFAPSPPSAGEVAREEKHGDQDAEWF